MKKSVYANISVPRSLIDEIDSVIGTLGYTSIPEFVKDSCRRRLDELNSKKEDA